ncbi:Cytochrome P450 3A27 [Toxocara canis]|uniref:Cytochrome P450 3A27 n=1 Tax=Toxocara canis TaxID=6265 RepID=A0A0B2UXZ4_TOXCA|nr:Cytochrome P450 3A27 [Toxocara canis]
MIGFGEAAIAFYVPVFISFMVFNTMTGGVACILALAAYFLWTKQVNEYWKSQGVPGPTPNFFFGNFLQMQKGFHLYDIENARKYGPIYGGSVLGFRELNVCDVEMIKRIFIQEFPAFPERVMAEFFAGNQRIRKNMINILYGQRWKDLRRTVSPAFTPGRIQKILPLMSRCIQASESILDDCIKNSNGIIDSKKFFCNFAMDVMAQCAFGVDLSTQKDQRESEFVRYALKIFETPFVDSRIMFLVLFPNVMRLLEKTFNFQLIGNSCDAFFEGVLRRIIEERRKNPYQVNHDFLQLLLDTSEGRTIAEEDDELPDAIASGNKVALTEIELLAQGYLFLAVGFQTTATILQFATYSLASNPHVQEIAHDHIMEVAGNKEIIEYEDLMKMPYIEQVMFETLRMYPPVPRSDRRCRSSTMVNDIMIEKDTFVFVPTYAIHYDERNYPNPQVFDPDRFSPTEKAKRDQFAYVPFGVGPRSCVGRRFGEIEIRLTLAYLLRKFRFSVPEEYLGKPLEIDTVGMTKAKWPTHMTVTRRN